MGPTAASRPAAAHILDRNLLLASLRETLAGAIGAVFVLVAIALGISFVVTIFLREIPLRGRGTGPRRFETSSE